MGWTNHQRSTGTVPARRRCHEISKTRSCRGGNCQTRIFRERYCPLGIVLLVCTLLYLIPRTPVLGAILLTGYLGGAVATHVRVGEGLFSILFPIIFGVLIWLGLYLRDDRLRALLPLER